MNAGCATCAAATGIIDLSRWALGFFCSQNTIFARPERRLRPDLERGEVIA